MANDEQVVVKCDNCGAKLKTQKKNIGRRARCPKCGSVIKLDKGKGGVPTASVETAVESSDIEGQEDALLHITRQNDVMIVNFSTSRILDHSNVQQLGDEIDALVENHNIQKIVVNFEKIHYMSSAVMGKLVSLYKTLDAAGGELRLCNISDSIYEIFEIMRFDELFDICDTEDDAVIELMD
ncbi:MAG: anti-sigma factor antagonist [Candidatus Brocadiia bacterium]